MSSRPGPIWRASKITLQTWEISYHLKRTRRRRSIALRVEPSGAVTVLAPRFALSHFVERFVQSQAGWIKKKLIDIEELRKKHPPKEFVSGEMFSVWGQEYPLHVVSDAAAVSSRCEWVDGRLQIRLKESDGLQARGAVKDLLCEWYARQTEGQLKESVPALASAMGVSARQVKVAEQRKRWGSCSRTGNLRFNWRLSMMPRPILDYVIIHELAHIKAHNHSKAFWDIVRLALPDFKERRTWLRKNGSAATRWD